jgi:hypothetical protein
MIIRAQDLPVSILLDIAQEMFRHDETSKLNQPDIASMAQALIRLNPVICEFDPASLVDLFIPEYNCMGCHAGIDVDTGYCDKCQQERAGLDI